MDHEAITSQIRAALKMLRSAIEACPETLWNRESDRNRTWALAYHALYFAHLYLSPSEEAFQAFDFPARGRDGFGRTDLEDWSKLGPEDVYSLGDVLAYWEHVDGRVADLVRSAPLDGPSGFHWLPFTKAEAHLYNMRHIQHHAGQLSERVRQASNTGVRWEGRVR
jgi:hypothetical protein